MRDDHWDDQMPYGVDTIRLRISFPAAPVSHSYNGRAWKMRPLRGWTGGQGADAGPSVGAADRAGTMALGLDHMSIFPVSGQAIPAGQPGEDKVRAAELLVELGTPRTDKLQSRGPTANGPDAEHGLELWQQALAEARLEGCTTIKAASDIPAKPASDINAVNGESGPTAQASSSEASSARAKAGDPSPSSSGVEEHGKLWWWLHDHGLMMTRHERADNLRKGWGAESEVLVTDGNGMPVNVGQLSDDEVIALDKELRGQPIGPALAAAAPITSSWGWNNQEPYREAKRQLAQPGTHNTLNGKVPTRAEATRMIEEVGGKVDRQDVGHPIEGDSTHHEPHINYYTPKGYKATVTVRDE